MARRLSRIEATQEKTLTPLKEHCKQCGQLLWVAGHNHRTIITLSGVWKLILVIRQCIQSDCPNYLRRQHPEEEGGWALPHSEFGLDIIFFIGLRHFHDRYHGSKIHQVLKEYKVSIAQRSITHLMHRYKELATWPPERIKTKLRQQGQVALAIDILQFQIDGRTDDRILGAIRDCLSTETLLVRLLHNTDDLKFFLTDIRYFLRQLRIPVKDLIFSGDEIIRDEMIRLVTSIFPAVPYQLCQFQYFEDAAIQLL